MDLDPIALRRSFEEWAGSKNYPEELWPALWEAYMQGIYDAPSPYAFLEHRNYFSEELSERK